MSEAVSVDVVVEKVETAHKRIDAHEQEIKLLRDAKHKHAGMLQNHNGILHGLEAAVNKLNSNTEKNTNAILEAETTVKAIAGTAGLFAKVGSWLVALLVSIIIALLGFILTKFLGIL